MAVEAATATSVVTVVVVVVTVVQRSGAAPSVTVKRVGRINDRTTGYYNKRFSLTSYPHVRRSLADSTFARARTRAGHADPAFAHFFFFPLRGRREELTGTEAVRIG